VARRGRPEWKYLTKSTSFLGEFFGSSVKSQPILGTTWPEFRLEEQLDEVKDY